MKWLMMLVLSLTPMGAFAQEKQVTVSGFGRSSCGLWLEARSNRQIATDLRFLQAQEWIAGYLSAYNIHVAPNGNIASRTDDEGIYAWLDQYCRANPTTIFMEALDRFVRSH